VDVPPNLEVYSTYHSDTPKFTCQLELAAGMFEMQLTGALKDSGAHVKGLEMLCSWHRLVTGSYRSFFVLIYLWSSQPVTAKIN